MFIVLFIAFCICMIALRKEADDFAKIEKKRDDVLKDKSTVKEMVSQVERVRRVTWRMGILGSSILASLLYAMNLIPLSNWISVAVPSWIIITSVLNFRAYHVEDEGMLVLKVKGNL